MNPTAAEIGRLGDLLGDPRLVEAMPPEVARALLLQLAPLTEALRLRALSPPASVNGQPEAPAEDRLLTVEEAAQKLGLSRDWCYRQAKRLPFAVRIGRQLRFSERGIERYIRQRQGR
jgi:excisionase family DNA binding protein